MSNMPPIEQIEADHLMKIERLIVNNYPHERLTTMLDIRTADYHVKGYVANVYGVSEPRVKGYMPSKVWITSVKDDIPQIEMSFYVNSTLPPQSRPFGDGPMYVFAVQVDADATVEYHIETRVFIDHIVHDNKVWYVFCFGQAHFDGIIAKQGGTTVSAGWLDNVDQDAIASVTDEFAQL